MTRFSYLFFAFTLSFNILNKEVRSQDNPIWIIPSQVQGGTLENSWFAYKKTFSTESLPTKVNTQIAVDSKYWLWINDSLIVREGGLKWGPRPDAYYYDELDIAPFLKEGLNEVAVLVWYFGKDGMSHKDSGRPGLYFSAPALNMQSDSTWLGIQHPAFLKKTSPPHPNWRLVESNIYFDAREAAPLTEEDPKWIGLNETLFAPVKEFYRDVSIQKEKRPIPYWKDFGLKAFSGFNGEPFISKGDTLVLPLPYNMQVNPYFEIEAPAGKTIDIRTDNYKGGSEYNLRTVYITQEGRQRFETPSWINGHEIRYYFPAGVKIMDLRYRETGYATGFEGAFNCSDPFFNELWKKSRRTLYLTMRDNYMDCPDRERAQWWGDVVLESGETFYSLSRESDLLTKKAIRELMHWQKPDKTIYSPIPAGNWEKELPTQMLSSIGYYGIWNYFIHTGDTALLKEVYPKVKTYLTLWQVDKDGLVIQRKGGWLWGDWGTNKDMPLLFNGWYYLALKGARFMAEVLGKNEDAKLLANKMDILKNAFNAHFWKGKHYCSPNHSGPADDRGQALAIVAGIAPPEYYQPIGQLLDTARYASPYMEKYILEALAKAGYAKIVLSRMKDRFRSMVDSPLTTLWEGWDIGSAVWGGGTYNHAWSGGGLTILSQYFGGVEPLEAGYKKIKIKPLTEGLAHVNAIVPSVRGQISVSWEKLNDTLEMNVIIPEKVEEGEIWIPLQQQGQILVNQEKIWPIDTASTNASIKVELMKEVNSVVMKVPSGMWNIQSH